MATGGKKKEFGRGSHVCSRCGRKQGLVRRYKIYLCRQCLREWAPNMNFHKYS